MKINWKDFFRDLILAILIIVGLLLIVAPLVWRYIIVDEGYGMAHSGTVFWTIYFLVLIIYIIISGFYLYKNFQRKAKNKILTSVKPQKQKVSKKIIFLRIFLGVFTGFVYLIFYFLSVIFFVSLINNWEYQDGVPPITTIIFTLIYLVAVVFIMIRVMKNGNYKYMLFGLILVVAFYFWRIYWGDRCDKKYNTGYDGTYDLNFVIGPPSQNNIKFHECLKKAGIYFPIGD